jgi:alpha-methylacyl-CoA racemase
VAGPLHGIRIIELPAIGPVPFLGMLFADLGAEMVRIDKIGDTSGGVPAGGGAPAGKGVAGGGMFSRLPEGPLGRGRRSIRLDVRKPGGAEVVLRLIERVDALIEGFRPGVAERLGIGPDVALARNPALVYGRMTGWGQHGPLAPTAGHDITYLAVSGLLHGIGSGDGPPVPPVNYVADFAGGSMFLATGLLAGLLHARASGEGQVVDAAMTEGAGYLGSMTRALLASGAWKDERGANVLDGGAPNYRCYECADGKYVAVGALEPQFWAALLDGLGLDAATVPSPYDPAQWQACASTMAGAFRARTRDQWAEHFAALDACVAPVLTLEEAPGHPHNRARGSYVGLGAATVPGPAPRFSVTAATTAGLTSPGADTDALLTEAGYSEKERDELRRCGTVAGRDHGTDLS